MVLVVTGSIILLVRCVMQMMLLCLLHLHQPSESCSIHASSSLIFTASPSMLKKNQLIKFYKSPRPVTASLNITFLGKKLLLSNSISHLGHILTYNLSDDEDIRKTSRDMCCKANYLLHVFSCCDPFVKT